MTAPGAEKITVKIINQCKHWYQLFDGNNRLSHTICLFALWVPKD